MTYDVLAQDLVVVLLDGSLFFGSWIQQRFRLDRAI